MFVGARPLNSAKQPQFQAPSIGGNTYGTFSNEQQVQNYNAQASSPRAFWRSLPAPWNTPITRTNIANGPLLAQRVPWTDSNQCFTPPPLKNLHTDAPAQALPHDGSQLANLTSGHFNAANNTHDHKRKRRESIPMADGIWTAEPSTSRPNPEPPLSEACA